MVRGAHLTSEEQELAEGVITDQGQYIHRDK